MSDLIDSGDALSYIRKANAVNTVNGQQRDIATLRGATEAVEIYVASGADTVEPDKD